MEWPGIVVSVVAGLAAGAYINALTTRWIGWRLVLPALLGWEPPYSVGRGIPPACSACGGSLAIGPLQVLPSLPVLGRCRHCRAPLARRYALTEILTAGLFGAAATQFRSWDVLVAVLVLFGFLVAISVVDIAAHRIPTRWVYETGAVLVILVVFTALRRDLPSALAGAAIGAFGYFGFLLFFHLLSPRRMGFGDVRLAWVMGLVLGFLGWSSAYPVFGPIVLVVWGAFLGSLIGTVIGLTVLVVSRRNRYFPFGPGLAAGTIVVLLFITSFRPLP